MEAMCQRTPFTQLYRPASTRRLPAATAKFWRPRGWCKLSMGVSGRVQGLRQERAASYVLVAVR